MNQFGKRLKHIRTVWMNIDQEALGKLCGLSSTTISHFETGNRTPSLKNLRKLKKGTGCSYDQLLDED